ncbi:hypothetical protein CRE_15383 [Caenorhabditis remanei]|uniref:Uncharacterized protein n=1 Tax=Caenorhabditis remanei TaxID=31234 RepID=E3MC21_CAERE|nr:hypothetical protein CRE_15383 [Caenorhabditis remanei]
MTSIIKNQLVKHLSKFTKNLKPEQISLDVLKGNSKLQFIEINEDVLTEILELPSWLKIKKAYCTGVAVNVPWTKLKTCPIQIFIDEINVDVELTNEAKKTPGKSNPLANLGDSSSYGFMNKIIENMSLYISSVEINFDSDVFGGSFMLQRLSVESRSPGWAQVKDLRQTRITCSTTNRTLMFKQLSWHLLRIEASAKTSKHEKRSKINAPLRLITSGGKIRIALKKNAVDGSVIHARIQTILDDILWVATLPQLRSAISFASYITNLVKESQKNEVVTTTHVVDSPLIRTADKDTDAKTTTSAYNIFHFDQTSYHLHVKKIDLHLCDDAHTASDYPPDWDIESGAMQVTLHQVLIDVYPKAHAHSDRSTWMRYANPNPIAGWFKSHLSEQFLTLSSKIEDPTTKTRLERCWPQLIGFFVVLRVHDLAIQCVSDMNTKKDALTNLFESERHLHSLPSDQQIVHVEFGTFYHPASDQLPVPNSAVYFQLGPFTITFDERTTRWCCYVAHALSSAIEDGHLIPEKELDIQPPTIKISLVMPRLVLNLPGPFTDFNFPRRLVTSMSTLTVSSSPIDFKDHRRFIAIMERPKDNHEVKHQLKYGANRFHIATSPVWIEIDHGSQTKGFPFLNDVSFIGIIAIEKDWLNVLIEPVEDVALMIDHYQFLQVSCMESRTYLSYVVLQLTRLGDKFTRFFDQLALDMKHYNVGKPPSELKVDFISALHRVRLYIVLTMGEIPSPYDQAAMNNFNHSFMDRLSGMFLFIIIY